MAKRIKPNYQKVWAELGDNTKPVDSYIETGWLAVKPPRQYMNWIQNRQDGMLAYLNQAGVSEWDVNTDYEGAFSYVQGSDNKIYKCLADNGPSVVGATNKDPVNQPTNAAFWEVAFADKSAYDTLASTVATHTTQIGNGSGVTDPAAWRTSLSVDSSAQVDAKIAATILSGGVIQSKYAEISAATAASGLSADQLSVSITPTSALNKLRITASGGVTGSAAHSVNVEVKVYQEGVERGAFTVLEQDVNESTTLNDVFYARREVVSGGTSAQTISFRVSTGTVRQYSSLVVEEIKA